jgi:hypothetical protein
MARALLNFRALQGEVILNAPLRGSEIRWMAGVSSPFDELCDRVGIPVGQRDELFARMVKAGAHVEEPRYTPPGGAQRALRRAIDSFYAKLETLGVVPEKPDGDGGALGNASTIVAGE